MNIEFKELKNKIKELLKNKNEITSKTNYNNGGIYLLYVDNFDDDKIIPMYIGKATSFQERHKEHLKELFALNRLSKNYYTYKLINKYYDGYYKSCKIFKYMVDNNCTLKDIRMIVLEENDDEKARIKLEYEYINKYKATFFGFNQLNSITLQKSYTMKGLLSEFYLTDVENDILNINKYMEYGFNKFNYMLASGIFEYYGSHILSKIKIKSELNELKQEQSIITDKRDDLINYINNTSINKCIQFCGDIIDSFFKENNLKSEDKKKKIIKYLLFGKEETKKEVMGYIKRHALNKTEDIFELIINKKGKEINKISNTIKEYQEKICEYDDNAYNLGLMIYADIIPNKEYNNFPLKDSYIFKNFDVVPKNNTLYLNIEFSNHGKRKMKDDYPCILKVDYLFSKNGIITSNNYFIKSEFDNFFINEDKYLINQNMYNFLTLDPFNIWKCSDTYNQDTISTTMEYYNGINEFTLLEKEKYEFSDIVKEIEDLINEDTEIVYTSGCKALIKSYSYIKSLLIKKIIKTLK